MNNTSFTSSNLDFTFPFISRTAEPGESFYIWDKFSYIPQKRPVLYRLNMPLVFESNLVMIPLSIYNKTQQDDAEFSSYLYDALKRYSEINNGAIFDTVKVESFLSALKNICNSLQLQPYVIFNKFATKVQLSIDNKEFVLDYDHEDLDTVFILSSKDGILTVKESTLDKLEESLRFF